TIVFVTQGVMMPLGGWLSDRLTRSYGARFGRRAIPLAGLSAGAVLLFAGTIASGTVGAVLSMSLATGFVSWCEGPFWAAAIEIGGKRVGAAAGLLHPGGNLGGFLAPIVPLYVASRFVWSWGFYGGSRRAKIGMIASFLVAPATHEARVHTIAANAGIE